MKKEKNIQEFINKNKNNYFQNGNNCKIKKIPLLYWRTVRGYQEQ